MNKRKNAQIYFKKPIFPPVLIKKKKKRNKTKTTKKQKNTFLPRIMKSLKNGRMKI